MGLYGLSGSTDMYTALVSPFVLVEGTRYSKMFEEKPSSLY